jgi:FAD/FMN-containing dehydrogenase
MHIIYHPTASLARGLENLNIAYETTPYTINKWALALFSRIVAIPTLPLILTLELVFKRIPKLLLSCMMGDHAKMKSRFIKVEKFALAILFSPLIFFSASAVSSFFLKNPHKKDTLTPFGVEKVFVKSSIAVTKPKTRDELQALVKKAIDDGKKISIVGAGFSQGIQTVPSDEKSLVISLEHLKTLTFADDNKTVTAEAGAIWENIQYEANLRKKSVIVKQASDPFSVGGSIAINCHGWAHEDGSISSVVEEIEVLDATGEIIKLKKGDERFGHYFGTLGYLGIVVSAKIQLTDNCELSATCETIKAKNFSHEYKTRIKKGGYPLFYGRLSLDSLDKLPLQEVCLQKYAKKATEKIQVTSEFKLEPKFGKRIERIFMQAVSHLNHFFAQRLLRFFWNREKAIMIEPVDITRNEILHPPINVFKKLTHSNLHTQWLQEYFLTEDTLAEFLKFLGQKLKDNDVRLINASIRPVPKDTVSILPYAEQDRHAVVLCFHQMKTEKAIEKTKKWIEEVHNWLLKNNGKYYMAYMPFASKEQFTAIYGGDEALARLKDAKQTYDPTNVFSSAHTQKYFD